jgi:hypothetical protein
VILFEKFNWRQLRERESSGSLEEQLKIIFSELSKILHGRKTVSKVEALHAFQNTLKVVESLYRDIGCPQLGSAFTCCPQRFSSDLIFLPVISKMQSMKKILYFKW